MLHVWNCLFGWEAGSLAMNFPSRHRRLPQGNVFHTLMRRGIQSARSGKMKGGDHGASEFKKNCRPDAAGKGAIIIERRYYCG